MKKLGWTAVAAAYVASVVFSFGAINAMERARPAPEDPYETRKTVGAIIALVPVINLVVGAIGFLADGWTWDRSEPVKEPQPRGILEVDCSKGEPWCGWDGISCVCTQGGKQ